ncbi:YCF48-related protein [Paraburkholderia sp. D1E]|uniref:YCF48-related protein n=1 Tax=Paraburkholderia sp. D1E TaxID=3461398 RepID=UPI00404627EE
MGKLKLTVNEEKTRICKVPEGEFDFLRYTVYFKSSTEGWAVGLWSLMLHTTDGGATWSKLTLSPPGAKKLDRNLYSIFGDRHDNLFIACEQGSVARSTDGGQTWTFVDTGYAGSFWTGVALQDGTLLVGGLRGTVYRSTDGGNTWLRSNTAFRSSVTDMVEMPDKSVVTVGLDGVSSFSKDDGVSFAGKQRADRTALTAVVEGRDGRTVFFSASGPIHP